MDTLDPVLYSEFLIDGNIFLTMLYKLSRLQEQVLLGELEENKIVWEMFTIHVDRSVVAPAPSSLDHLVVQEFTMTNSRQDEEVDSDGISIDTSYLSDGKYLTNRCIGSAESVYRPDDESLFSDRPYSRASMFATIEKFDFFKDTSSNSLSTTSSLKSVSSRATMDAGYVSDSVRSISELSADSVEENSKSMLSHLCSGRNPWLLRKPSSSSLRRTSTSTSLKRNDRIDSHM